MEPDELESYFKECIRIEPGGLHDEFVRLPADFAYWNEQYKMALEAFLRGKATLEQEESRAYLGASNIINPATGKPYTVDGIKALVATQESVVEARTTLIGAEVEMVRLKGVLEAIRTKRDMIIQMGAHVRTEMQHDPLVRKAASDARMMRDD